MYFIKRIPIVILLLLIAFVTHTLISSGFFRTVENQFSGKVLKKIPLPGAEDITISQADSFALISSTNRAIYPPVEEEKGGLYYMDLRNGKFEVEHLTASFFKPFAPHGISMIKIGNENTYKVMAVNHTPKGHSIEVFTLKGKELTYENTLTTPAMISPNDLMLIDDNRFYFTNDHGYTKGIGKFLEEYVGLAVSNVVYFHGSEYKTVAEDIAYANGINFDPERNLVFVASPRKFLIKVYSKKQDGSLEFIEDIPCGTGVDNIEMDAEGSLWVGGHPNLLKFKAYAKGSEKISPSEIIKIAYRKQGDFDVDKIYVEDGRLMSASTVAATLGDLILIGNVMDDEFLILRQEN